MTLAELDRELGLSARTKRILVIEDAVSFASRLIGYLNEMGHNVEAFLGVASIEDHILTGPAFDRGEPRSCPVDGFDIAFLDHYFLGSTHNGATVAKVLSWRGCPHIVAMSSDEGANRRMMKAGATVSLRKSDLARMLGQ